MMQHSRQDRDIGLDPFRDSNQGRSAQLADNSRASQRFEKTKILLAWIFVNTVATIAIVFTNKAIFLDKHLRNTQISFAAFHMSVTWLTLYVSSLRCFAVFSPKEVSRLQIVPLSLAMSLNIILPNLSLAYASTTLYQMMRSLLTPCVTAMNYVLYNRRTVSWGALLSLIPTCLGAGALSYYESLSKVQPDTNKTDPRGVVFGLAGVFFSSLYTIWVASFHRKLHISSMQLLLNQAPISALLLLYVIPFVDTFPVRNDVAWSGWVMVLLSGILASLINISQFRIIAQGGAVMSTVVGHLKTCLIVSLGWVLSGGSTSTQSSISIVVAILGIVSFSLITMLEERSQGR